MLSRIKAKNKRFSQIRSALPPLSQRKGVSIMVGYVLLVTLAIVMGIIAYNWMKTYIPREPTGCPDGVSLLIREATFNASTSEMVLVLKNNGRFNLAGYLMLGANISEQKLQTINLAQYLNESSGGKKVGNSVLFFSGSGNFLDTNTEVTHVFNIPPAIGNVSSISIIPIRLQEDNNRESIVNCGNMRTNQNVGEPVEECVPSTCSSLGYTQCNPPGWDGSDGCGGILSSCGSCSAGEGCNSTGQCETIPPGCGDSVTQTDLGEKCDNGTAQNVPPAALCIPAYGTSCASCSNLCEIITVQGPYCGDGTLTSLNEVCDDGNTVSGDGCSSTCTIETGWECSSNPTSPPASTCNLLCGNGIINSGEGCDDGNTASLDGCSSTCTVETFYNCIGQPSVCNVNVASCPSYCVSLNLGYSGSHSACTNSPGNCASNGGIYQSGGDVWCTGGSQADTCCCKP